MIIAGMLFLLDNNHNFTRPLPDATILLLQFFLERDVWRGRAVAD